MNPVIVSDEDKFNEKFDAAEALIDYTVDDKDVEPRNYWSGKADSKATFIYDLGCEAKVKEVHLRNSHGGKGNNRCVLHFLHTYHDHLINAYKISGALRTLKSVWGTLQIVTMKSLPAGC